MRHQFTLSDVGLKLIKSYEGFRPTARQLLNGRRVAGYGHAVGKGETLELSRDAAESLLKSDLAPYEALVNDHIFAPLTQGQFDALVSLAFNIGSDAFLGSDVLSALNNGRILDAANAFDIWRKSEVSGQVYTIDALVRRRTSEKVLFLRPEKATALAPRLELPPVHDDALVGVTTYGPKSLQPRDEDYGIVSGASDLSAHRDYMQSRRREDGPAGVLTLSEIYDDDDAAAEDIYDGDFDTQMSEYTLDEPLSDERGSEGKEPAANDDTKPSAIATAAAEVSERLDALIDRPRRNAGESLQSSLTDDVDRNSKVVPFKGRERRRPPTDNGGLPPSNAPALDRIETMPTSTAPSRPSQLDIMKARSQADRVGDTVGPTPLSTQSPSKTAERTLYDYEADMKEAEAQRDARDSAQRYIDRNSKAAGAKSRNPNTGPFSIMCVLGMILMGGGAGAYLSGFDTRWGVVGELASTLAFLIGALLLLGSVYYLLKILFGRR